jgi:hypothetical protein
VIKASIIFLTAVLLWGCAESSSPMPTVGSATRGEVSFLNSAINGDEFLKEITEPGHVNNLASYADKQLLNASTWSHLTKVSDRTANTVKVSFYDGGAYKGTLGLGFYDKDKFFLKFHSFNVSRVMCISNREKDEFLRLLGISQEESKRIFKADE